MTRTFLVLLLAFVVSSKGQRCEDSEFMKEKTGNYLRSHVRETFQTETATLCRVKCYLDGVCMSYNYHQGNGNCEINDSDQFQYPEDLIKKTGYSYVGTKNDCTRMPCRAQGICQTGVTKREYRCIKIPCESCKSGDCGKPLGMQNGGIPDAHITASSMWDTNHSPARARLNIAKQNLLRGAWVPSFQEFNRGAWLKVYLGKITCVMGIATQGRQDYLQWVTSYSLYFSLDNIHFENYGNGQELYANTDQNTVVRHRVDPVFAARYVKLVMRSWKGGIAMRMELYGHNPY